MDATATDVELLVASAAGDHGAFRILYDRVFDDIERYIASRVAADHVDDLVADTFVRIYRSARTFEDRGRPAMAWMVTIARNVVQSHYRSVAVRQGSPRLADDRTVSSIEELTLDRSQREAVIVALAGLDERQREVLALRFIEGLTVRACSKRLEMTEDGVRALTYRSLKALRRSMHELEGE